MFKYLLDNKSFTYRNVTCICNSTSQVAIITFLLEEKKKYLRQKKSGRILLCVLLDNNTYRGNGLLD